MRNTILIVSFLISIFFINSCLVIENEYVGLPPGMWRAVLKLDDRPGIVNKKGAPLPELMNLTFEEAGNGELPFNFEVFNDEKNGLYLEIINGSERIRVDDITIGLDKATAKDTVIINFPLYESYIEAIFEERVMEGSWVVPSRGNYRIPFVAFHGQGHRFSTLKKKPKMDITGKWETTFLDGDTPFPAIGEFQQNGNKVTGTFRTETGDYRFLEGEIQDDKLYLSVFDGAHAFLFEAKIQDDLSMIGSFRSGKHYKVVWEAKLNNEATLTDPNKLTFLKEGYDKVEFSFKNTEGKMVSLDDPAYQGKIKIIQIFGTWCPNCLEETKFLTNYLESNNHPDLKIIALGFEKHRDSEKAMQSLRRYKEKLNLPYEMLLAGYYDKKEAAAALPMLNHILSYPTLIFIDRNDQVRKIHTGFNGEATSQFKDFKMEFEVFVKELLEENI